MIHVLVVKGAIYNLENKVISQLGWLIKNK